MPPEQTEETAICRKCGHEIPIDQFTKDRKYCLPCNKKRLEKYNNKRLKKATDMFGGIFDKQPFSWIW